jgi:hypothetical protein
LLYEAKYMQKKTIIRLYALLLLLLVYAPAILKTYAQGGNYYLRVKLEHVALNGQTLDVSNPTIVVTPGSRFTGTVTFTVENVQPGSWITPVIWVTSWERGSTADGKVRVVTHDISTSKQFTVNVDVTAPTTPGTYYIGFFAGWMYDPDEVASNDHPPRYGDGDDVWDMSRSDWESVVRNGTAPEGVAYRMPGRAIRVIVQSARKMVIPKGGLSNDVSWKYVYDASPTVGWNKNLTFNDASWRTGRTPFGDYLFKRTYLYFGDLYLRKVFLVDTIPPAAIMSIASDDGVEVWVNGKKILNDINGAHSAAYWNYRLDVAPYLKLGENLLAIHVRNIGGNAYFDCETDIRI